MTSELDPARRWSSLTTFVVVAIVALVNLSAFWRLPHWIATGGGSAFIAVYVVAGLALGIPLVAGQLLIARGTGRDIPGVIAAAVGGRRGDWFGRVLGFAMLAVIALLLALYTVVASWSMAFAVRGIGGFLPSEPAAAVAYFSGFVRNSSRGWGWLLLFIVIVAVVVGNGMRRGLAPFMWTLAGLLVVGVAAVTVIALLGGETGPVLGALFGFRPLALSWSALVAALGQVVFGLSLGTGVLLALGAYLPGRAPVVKLASTVVVGQITVSLAAAVAIALLVGRNGLAALISVDQLFVALPAWASDSGLAAIVLLLMAAAALSTAAALFEPLVASLEGRLAWSRQRASLFAAAGVFALGLVMLLSFGPLVAWPLLDARLFQHVVWLTGGVLLPLAARALVALSIELVRRRSSEAHDDARLRTGLRLWLGILRVPALLALVVVALAASGALAWARALWSG